MDDDSNDDVDNELDQLDLIIKAPPMRTKEKHGACKRKRKEARKAKSQKLWGAPIPHLMHVQRQRKLKNKRQGSYVHFVSKPAGQAMVCGTKGKCAPLH